MVYNDTTIDYVVIFSRRKTLGIVVKTDKSVVVKAPVGADMELIRGVLVKRAEWIIKQQQRFESMTDITPQRRYVSGELHYYLGEKIQLKVVEGGANSVCYQQHSIVVVCSPAQRAEELVTKWYRERAQEVFAELAEPLIEQFASKYHVRPSSLHIRTMKTRWGSCTARNKITLNSELVKTHRSCIEYVIIHELCHLIQRNHSKAFYDLLEQEMPSWKHWRTSLNHFVL